MGGSLDQNSDRGSCLGSLISVTRGGRPGGGRHFKAEGGIKSRPRKCDGKREMGAEGRMMLLRCRKMATTERGVSALSTKKAVEKEEGVLIRGKRGACAI